LGTLRQRGDTMLDQLRYFQAVVKNNSFSEAAAECHISQSAISQQVQALERELGFKLLDRKHRRFSLTPAGEYFYRKSLILVSDYEQIRQEAAKIAHKGENVLRVGYLRGYSGGEFLSALALFSGKYPEVSVQVRRGTHEELCAMLRNGSVDLVLNDQRRAFSDEYVNLILATTESYIEISGGSPLASLSEITPQELKNTPCILISSEAQRNTERDFYELVIGFQGEFLYAENLEEARVMVIGGKGFLPVEGVGAAADFMPSVRRIPLVRKEGGNSAELLRVLAEGQLWLLCGGICGAAEGAISNTVAG